MHLGLKVVPYMGTLGSKYTHMDTWTLRVKVVQDLYHQQHDR